jgi:hypothetical protein
VRSMAGVGPCTGCAPSRPTRTPRRTVETPNGQSSRSSACSSLL